MVAGYGALAATLLVSGLGIRQTLLQYRSVRGSLLDAHTRLARTHVPHLVESLDEAAAAALERIASRAGELEGLEAARAADELIEEPFVITANGTLASPLAAARSATRRCSFEEAPPVAFDVAARDALAAEELPGRVAPLLEFLEHEGQSPVWRLRAACLAAAQYRAAGKLAEAADLYRRLLRELGPRLARDAAPSVLHIRLALQEALHDAGRLDAAAATLVESLAALRAGAITPTFAEEEFFLRRARASLRRNKSDAATLPLARDDLDWLTARIERQRTSIAVLELLRDWIGRSDALSAETLDAPAPRRFYQEVRGTPVLALWRPFHPESSYPARSAIGFRVSSADLAERLAAFMDDRDPGNRLVARLGRHGSGFVNLATLDEPYWFVGLGYDEATWKRLEGEARQPFIVAAALIGGLGIVLVTSLAILLRSARREMLLARYKTEFVANVSHELKTPLALIRLFAETLLLGRVTEEDRRNRYYEIITRESERLGQLIANVLDFSSIEAGRKEYDLRACRLDEVVRATIESYRFELDEKGFSYSLSVEDSVPPTAADSDAVAQALINLLQNAVKYSTETRDIRIDVRHGGGEIRVAVSDRGCGIPREEQSLVWKDYYRSRSARRSGTRGSGLGLSLVRHIVEAHGGRVALESEPRRGSTFTLVFPVKPAREDAEAREDPGTRPEAGD